MYGHAAARADQNKAHVFALRLGRGIRRDTYTPHLASVRATARHPPDGPLPPGERITVSSGVDAQRGSAHHHGATMSVWTGRSQPGKTPLRIRKGTRMAGFPKHRRYLVVVTVVAVAAGSLSFAS